MTAVPAIGQQQARPLRGIPPRPIIPANGGLLPYFRPRRVGRPWLAVDDTLGSRVVRGVRAVGVLVLVLTLFAAMFAVEEYDHATSLSFTLAYSPRYVAYRQQMALDRLKDCGLLGAAAATVVLLCFASEFRRRRGIQ
jgi:hypothetical protein